MFYKSSKTTRSGQRGVGYMYLVSFFLLWKAGTVYMCTKKKHKVQSTIIIISILNMARLRTTHLSSAFAESGCKRIVRAREATLWQSPPLS